VNYGDGSGTSALTLSGTSFSLSHRFATAGVRTVTVTVTDDDTGAGTRTAQVTVVSPGDAVQALVEKVGALESAGTITHGESQALGASLDAAAKSLAKGNTGPAANQLEAFINKVEAQQRSGRLSNADAAALIAYARRVIASIG
jgi:hypothetical protein